MPSETITHLCQTRGVSLKHACIQAGIRYTTLHAQITHNRSIPFESVVALAGYFRVPLETFTQKKSALGLQVVEPADELQRRAASMYTAAIRTAQKQMISEGYDFGTDQVLDWLNRNSGRLDDFDQLRNRVDLFHPVKADDTMLNPAELGVQSLATQFFDIKGTDDYVQKVSKFDHSIIDPTMEAHITATKVPYLVSDQEIHVRVGDTEIRERYRRVISSVTDKDGKKYTLVHAKLI